MANFKFYRIGEANAEITRLEAECQRLTAELATANENSAAVVADAEKLKADASASAQAVADLIAAKASIESLSKERDALAAKLANPDGEVAKAASLKAQEIAASQGIPALPVKAESPAGNGPKNFTERCIESKQTK